MQKAKLKSINRDIFPNSKKFSSGIILEHEFKTIASCVQNHIDDEQL